MEVRRRKPFTQKEKDCKIVEELLAHVKERKENGNAKGQESKEKGCNDLLEEMFSRIKDVREDVKTRDQRAGKDAQEKEEKEKKNCVETSHLS